MLNVYHSSSFIKVGASFTAIRRDRYTTRSPFSVAVASFIADKKTAAPVEQVQNCDDFYFRDLEYSWASRTLAI